MNVQVLRSYFRVLGFPGLVFGIESLGLRVLRTLVQQLWGHCFVKVRYDLRAPWLGCSCGSGCMGVGVQGFPNI